MHLAIKMLGVQGRDSLIARPFAGSRVPSIVSVSQPARHLHLIAFPPNTLCTFSVRQRTDLYCQIRYVN